MSTARQNTDGKAPGLNLRVVQVRPERARRSDSAHPAREERAAQDLRKGRVAGRVEGSWSVQMLDGGPAITARRAAGCLLLPQADDLVLVLFDQTGGDHYLLNVLERETAARTLDFPGDASLNAPLGGLSLRARDLDMHGVREARLAGRELTLTAALGRMRFLRLDLLAESLDAGVRRVKAVGERLHLAASHLVSRLGRVVRSTGFELHRAGRLRTEVEKSYAVKAGRASILAKDDVTVDADKINLG
ncbi:MAG: DUF3540 domain-containing protein [Desulfovibrionaceae bacterium]